MIHSQKQREGLVHAQVRGFAGAGWIPGATDTNNGHRWWWYAEGSDYVICGRRLTGDKVCDAVGDPDIRERFSPAQVQRICATHDRWCVGFQQECPEARRLLDTVKQEGCSIHLGGGVVQVRSQNGASPVALRAGGKLDDHSRDHASEVWWMVTGRLPGE